MTTLFISHHRVKLLYCPPIYILSFLPFIYSCQFLFLQATTDKAHPKFKDNFLFQCLSNFHFCLSFSPSILLLFRGFIKKELELFSLGKKAGWIFASVCASVFSFLNHFQHLCLFSPLPFLPLGLYTLLGYLSVHLFIFHKKVFYFSFIFFHTLRVTRKGLCN